MDEVIDNAGFTMEAYMIQKDFPYEAVYDFEWLYGKLEPGRYRIVKNVMDFRGTRDYCNKLSSVRKLAAMLSVNLNTAAEGFHRTGMKWSCHHTAD